jgi:two-component system sensor kinase FixL
MFRSWMTGYGFAVAAVALMFLLKGPIEARVGAGPPLLLFLSAVILAAWYGGLGPGLFAAAMSALVCAMAYLSSFGPVVITRENNLFRLGLFLWEGALISLLMERLHAARRSADANASDARRYLEISRESEERFRSLSACSPVGIYLADLEGRCLYTNPRCQEIFGLCLEETLGEGWARFLHPADRARVLERWAGAARGAGSFDEAYRIVGPGGNVRWLHDRSVPVVSPEGGLLGHVGTVEDITASKDAERKALQAERLAAIGQMTAGLAHESRNALQRIQACLEMLGRRLGDRPDVVDLLEGIQEAQDDLHRMYEEVRSYAAPVVLDRRPMSLPDVLQEAWDSLEPKRRGRDARLSRSGLPVQPVEVDRFHLVAVFRNVLENALEACGDPVEIGVHWSDGDLAGQPAIRVAVRDNGPGLTADQRQRLFEPFYTTKVQGTGLGMAIASRLVEAHGGTIEAGPAEGQGPGTTIVITLPRGTHEPIPGHRGG